MKLKELLQKTKNKNIRQLRCSAGSTNANLILCRQLFNCTDMYVKNVDIELDTVNFIKDIMTLDVLLYTIENNKLVVELK